MIHFLNFDFIMFHADDTESCLVEVRILSKKVILSIYRIALSALPGGTRVHRYTRFMVILIIELRYIFSGCLNM